MSKIFGTAYLISSWLRAGLEDSSYVRIFSSITQIDNNIVRIAQLADIMNSICIMMNVKPTAHGTIPLHSMKKEPEAFEPKPLELLKVETRKPHKALIRLFNDQIQALPRWFRINQVAYEAGLSAASGPEFTRTGQLCSGVLVGLLQRTQTSIKYPNPYFLMSSDYNNKIKSGAYMFNANYCEWNTINGPILESDIPEFSYTELVQHNRTAEPAKWNVTEFATEAEQLLQELLIFAKPLSITFEEYVAQGLWATSGATNMPYNNKFKHVRKNQLLYKLTPQEIVGACFDGKPANSKAFLKKEPKKIRIIYNGDIGTNILMQYSMHHWEHVLDHIKQIQHRDTPTNFTKLTDTIRTAWQRGDLTLSFDFADFDQQPSKEIINLMFKFFRHLALANTTDPIAMQTVHDTIDQRWANSTLTWIEGGKHYSAPWLNGLPSGIAWTSAMGSFLNLIVQRIAARTSSVDMITVKGDDCIITGRPQQLLIHKFVLDQMGIKSSANKFGMPGYQQPSQRRCEFLRRMITIDNVYGYAARGLWNLIERKPWTDYDENNRLFEIVKSVNMTLRRVGDFRTQPAYGAAKYYLPSYLGGGAAVWPVLGQKVKALILKSQIYKVTKPPTHSDHPWFPQSHTELSAWLTAAEQQQLSNFYYQQTLTRDDDPEWFTEQYKRLRRSLRNAKIIEINFDISLTPCNSDLKFGKFSWLNTWAEARRTILRYSLEALERRRSLGNWMLIEQPKAYYAMRRLEHTGFSRGEAIDWLSGTLPGLPQINMNPWRILPESEIMARYVLGFFRNKRLWPSAVSPTLTLAVAVVAAVYVHQFHPTAETSRLQF